jgi:hypothetical protein
VVHYTYRRMLAPLLEALNFRSNKAIFAHPLEKVKIRGD